MYVDLDAIEENVEVDDPVCVSVSHHRPCNRLGPHELHAHFTVYGYPVAIWDDAGADPAV